MLTKTLRERVSKSQSEESHSHWVCVFLELIFFLLKQKGGVV